MKANTYETEPVILPYPETTMYGAVKRSAEKYPKAIAYDFMGKQTSYAKMIQNVDCAARALVASGIHRGDAVTICMPNTPQAIVCLYALNRFGAVANMIHPFSSQKEITFYLDYSDSRMILTLDLFYEKVALAREEAKRKDTVILTARMQDELYPHQAFGFWLKKGRSVSQFPNRENSVTWKDFLKRAETVTQLPEMIYDPGKPSVLLYSGGTSGTPKGIMLSDFNFNALGMQIREAAGVVFHPGLKFLSVMPLFHGFGLGIGIHTILENGMTCVLVPQFTNDSYAQLVVKQKPNFIAGVPTIYASLLKSQRLEHADLSCLDGVYSGGDSLPTDLKHRFDAFLREHNGKVQIREGYGLTECVTASCLTPVDTYKDGSIGLPLRDMHYRIVEPGTFLEKAYGEVGEIIISGPTLMLGYLNNPEETAAALKTDENGTTWLFTGDLGAMDSDGYVYYKQRMKRMIITSGYNVYPSQVENVLDAYPDIDYSCVIGVPDERKMQRIRAYIVLKPGVKPSEEEKTNILEHCKLYLAGYAKPKEIIFRDELPRTLVGKVAFHVLEEEAAAEFSARNETQTEETKD